MTNPRTIGIFASVRHAEKALLGMLQLEVLVLEFVPVDGLPTCPISIGKITSLDHELLDDTMESGAFVAKAFFACCQGTEVLCSLETHEHRSEP